MRIKMLSTQKGALDGICISTYTAGAEYDLGNTAQAKALAQAFIGARMAIEVTQETASSVIEKPATAGFFTTAEEAKAIESAPENKMVKRTYTRKAK